MTAPAIKLETHSVLVKIIRIVTVPLLNSLPGNLVKSFMRKSSHDASTVVAKGGTTHALEAMYTRYHRKLFSRGFFQGCADMFWHHVVSQPKALRNRLKIVQMELEEKLVEFSRLRDSRIDEPITLLSIAGGSARSIMYAILRLQSLKIGRSFKIVVLDKDKSALEVGERLAQNLGLHECFQWIHGTAGDIETLFPHERFDVVEIVGLLDYFNFDRARNLLLLSHNIMNDDGSIIIANVIPNSEQSFVSKTGWPGMQYRGVDEMRRLVEASGFTKDNDIIIEPLGVHCVVVARK